MVLILWFTFRKTFVSCHSNRTSKDTLGMSNYVSCPLSMLTYQKTFEVRLYIFDDGGDHHAFSRKPRKAITKQLP